MKVKVYVNWENKDILDKEDYDAEIKRTAESLIEDRIDFFDWLGYNYCFKEIWEATDADRIKIRNDWEECCKETARCNSDYEEVEIEI